MRSTCWPGWTWPRWPGPEGAAAAGGGSASEELVEFHGQVGAYNTAEMDATSNIFGREGGATNWGTFRVTVVPEASAMLFFLAGVGVVRRRRRRRAG